MRRLLYLSADGDVTVDDGDATVDDDDVTVHVGDVTVDVGDVKIDTSAKPIVRGPGYHVHTCTLPRVRRED